MLDIIGFDVSYVRLESETKAAAKHNYQENEQYQNCACVCKGSPNDTGHIQHLLDE